ncbi:MAG: lipid-A-disaccharide synthase [Candidatus Tokpelaia sp. JSC085]|nr:MAG: lipid-A-disaccharide synthase [Candidatus Tokpelaia sp. JSC085]
MIARLRIAIIAGEESSDLLGADLIVSLHRKTHNAVDLIGVGGKHLTALGLKSFFDPEEIALMGIGAVLKKIPRLISLIGKISAFIARESPHCLIIIDGPDFTHRVARRVRALNPYIPIIKYVAPSVWAWRSGRAKAMRIFIDHVLVILPFEVEVMKMLQGPPVTYVGHRLLSCPSVLDVCSRRKKKPDRSKRVASLVVLPGSRRFEIRRLMPVFGQTVQDLQERVPNLDIVLPTLPNIETELRALAAQWPKKPRVVVGDKEKWETFVEADIALAASGTVSLELALCGIPMVLAYKADWFSKIFIIPKVTVWSAALPNIIADEPVVPEYFNEFVRPGMLSRQLERHLLKESVRSVQLEGLKKIAAVMHTHAASGDLAAEAIVPFLPDVKKTN